MVLYVRAIIISVCLGVKICFSYFPGLYIWITYQYTTMLAKKLVVRITILYMN